MRNSYDLNGYRVRYFNGEDTPRGLVKKLNKFFKVNPQIDPESINVQWEGEEIGWTAYVVYIGDVENED